MKFKIISTIILILVVGALFVVFDDSGPSQQPPQYQSAPSAPMNFDFKK